MSFASQAREEIARRSLQKDCCVRAAAYGIACFAKYFDASGLVLQTEQELTTQVASQLFARCGVQGDIIEKQRPSGVVYEFSIRAPEQVARMHELFGTTGTETSLQIDPRLIRCQTCVSAYIGAAFLCSGTVTDPQKEYNIEFLTSRTNLARDFEALLAEHVHADADQRDNRDDEAEGLDPSERGAHRAGESRRKACLRVREVGEDHAVCGGGCDVFKHHFSFDVRCWCAFHGRTSPAPRRCGRPRGPPHRAPAPRRR